MNPAAENSERQTPEKAHSDSAEGFSTNRVLDEIFQAWDTQEKIKGIDRHNIIKNPGIASAKYI
jgi:hypothetical protein